MIHTSHLIDQSISSGDVRIKGFVVIGGGTERGRLHVRRAFLRNQGQPALRNRRPRQRHREFQQPYPAFEFVSSRHGCATGNVTASGATVARTVAARI
ncbi:hypothetical protein ACFCYB_33745 [Streptomyces sp. NPDC056309]|uniref:hypothetical protein n=1 Tax=unclassified Streptomyces TaxID=2593676 RepID=UPI0035D62557